MAVRTIGVLFLTFLLGYSIFGFVFFLMSSVVWPFAILEIILCVLGLKSQLWGLAIAGLVILTVFAAYIMFALLMSRINT